MKSRPAKDNQDNADEDSSKNHKDILRAVLAISLSPPPVAAQTIRECPYCELKHAVIEDGYCVHCRSKL
jgi:hypothetical protein